MKPEEMQEFNKKCAEFLNAKNLIKNTKDLNYEKTLE